jgi:hypothetical protein
MNIIVTAISSLVVGLTIFIITRWYDKRERKKTVLEKMKEEMIQIKAMLEGHKSFSDTVARHDTAIEFRKEICESNHKWNGIDRRQTI